MKTVVGLSLLAGASAFVPAAPFVPSASVAGRTRGDVSMAAVEKSKSIPFLPRPANLDGTIPGDVGFDPVGFTNWLPVPYLQEAEIKHGRIAMLATAGWIFADFVKLPGEVHQVSSLAAHDVAVKSGALHQILIWTSIAEAVSLIAITQMLGGSGRKPGEFKFDPLNLAKDEKSFKDLQLKEIKNGRLAMLAFSGIVTQAALYNSPFPYI